MRWSRLDARKGRFSLRFKSGAEAPVAWLKPAPPDRLVVRAQMPQIQLPVIPKLTVTSVIDILTVAILLYNFLLILKGRRALHVLNGLALLGLVYVAAVWLKLELLRSVFATLAPYTGFALVVMFQAEIRRWLSRLGRVRWL